MMSFQVRGASSSRSTIKLPDGLDDVAAEQRRRHVNVLGEPPSGQFQGTPPRSL